MKNAALLVCISLVTLAACNRDTNVATPSGIEPGTEARVPIPNAGPDEFLVIEQGVLERPALLDGPLPAPQPGAPSRVTPDPEGNVAALLAGDAGRTARAGQGAALLPLLGIEETSDTIRETISAEHEALMNPRDTLYSIIYGRPVFNPFRGDRLDPARASDDLRQRYPGAAVPVEPPSDES
jgi:hypothetical protein